MTKYEDKLKKAKEKLEQVKSVPQEPTPVQVFVNKDMENLYTKFNDMQEVIKTTLDTLGDTMSERYEKRLTELNDKLVNVMDDMLQKGVNVNNLDQIEKVSSVTVENLKDLVIPEVKDLDVKSLPDWLASEKSIKQVNKNLANIAEQLGQLENLKQGQQPENFVPFRRVVQTGKRLEFDDTSWSGARGGGGSGGGTGGGTGGEVIITDEGGDKVTVTNGKLDVNASVDTTGLATSAGQTTANTSLGNIDTNAGATTDAVVAAGATGSVSAKLRRVTTDLDAVKTSVASIDGKVTAVNTGSVTIGAALPAGTNAIGKLAANSGVDIGDVDVTSAVITGGAVAHDSADANNPIKVGFKAKTALSGVTLVASDDRADAYSDLDSAQLVRTNGAIGDYVNGTASNTDGTSTQVLAAGAAGIKHYITDVTIANTSASNIYVELKDGASAKWVFPVPANGGVTHQFATPIGGTAATAWNFDPSAAATTVYCSVSGFKSKI